LSNSTHFRFVKITTQASEKHDNQHGKQSNYPYFKLAPWNGVNIFNKGNNNTKHSFQHLLISVKRINQTIRVFLKCFESTLYLVEKNVIGNKRQMHNVLFKQRGVFVIEIRMSLPCWLSCFSEAWVVILTNLKCVEFDNL
jgi:hypothetical protein